MNDFLEYQSVAECIEDFIYTGDDYLSDIDDGLSNTVKEISKMLKEFDPEDGTLPDRMTEKLGELLMFTSLISSSFGIYFDDVRYKSQEDIISKVDPTKTSFIIKGR